MKIILHDNGLHLRFAPLTLTRPVGDLRIGIFTNMERWRFLADEAEIFYATEHFLTSVFPSSETADFVVNASVIPNEDLAAAVLSLEEGEQLWRGEDWIARRGDGNIHVEFTGEMPVILRQRWDLFLENGTAIESDFNLITAGRTSVPLSTSNLIIGDESRIFIEPGATVEAAILNTVAGPIYIGKDAEIMEGSVVRGPFAMCEHSALKIGAKVYGPTTLGPHCKVGGEVNNVVFQAYSNKGHDGFLGNSLIGEWCNLGADTNTSNLKNNYKEVSTYSYESELEEPTNVQFMGVCMGDHSKCGINTMFNTATVVGVSSNVFGAGFPDKYIPSFSWGGAESMVTFRFDKAIEYANNMMARRGKSLSEGEIAILQFLADHK